MKKISAVFALTCLLSLSACSSATDFLNGAPIVDGVDAKIISYSRASYSGSCPCPYDTDSAGRKCGDRSAYSRPGGTTPICYPSQINQSMRDTFNATGHL